jgi:DNA modification methylase
VTKNIQDIKPYTPVASLKSLQRENFRDCLEKFDTKSISAIVGMSPTFIRKVVGHNNDLKPEDVLLLIDQDSFSETFIPRSKIPEYLISKSKNQSYNHEDNYIQINDITLITGNAYKLIPQISPHSVQCVVTSTPYWGMRLYDSMHPIAWADGEVCAFGMEQTPESFVRHSVEILAILKPVMTEDSSVWWNIMDTFNTRTQIRNNAVEALRAMQGKDKTGWTEHACRRYSAGHSYLKDGEQCLIPTKIAERASRIGYFVKSIISWSKTSSLPEPQNSRVSRNVEYVIHLSLQRSPRFHKEAYRNLLPKLGGRNSILESDKLSDFWHLPTSSGRDGHGAQFPLALPGRCIALSSDEGELVLDPFAGAGTSAVAAKMLGRKFIGFDTSEKYVEIAIARVKNTESTSNKEPSSEQILLALEALQESFQ